MQTIAHPSIILPKFLGSDASLSKAAKLVLVLLDDYRNKVTGQCNPRIERMARDLAVCRRTIERALIELYERGLVAVKYGQRVSHYIIAAREQWLKILAQARIRFSTAVEKPAKPNPPPQRTEGEDTFTFSPDPETTECRNTIRQNVATEPPHLLLNLLNEPTNTANGGCDAARSVHHAQEEAAATAPAIFDVFPVETPTPCCVQLPFVVEGFPASTIEVDLPGGYKLQNPLSIDLWQALMQVHPQPGQPVRALVEIDKFLVRRRDPVGDAVRLHDRHVLWCEYWETLEKGAFIPQLWRWMQEGDWRVKPVIRTPARRAFESAGERSDRLSVEGRARAEEVDRKRRAKGIFYAPEKPEDYQPNGELKVRPM